MSNATCIDCGRQFRDDGSDTCPQCCGEWLAESAPELITALREMLASKGWNGIEDPLMDESVRGLIAKVEKWL